MHKINKIVVTLLVIFGLIFLGGTGLVVVFNLLDRPPSLSEMGTLRRFRVQEGAGVAAVAQQLTEAGLVRSPSFSD